MLFNEVSKSMKYGDIGIYKIENLINKKVYIGQSVNIKSRWQVHYRESFTNNSSYPIHNALRKYGVENFDFSILCYCKKEELNEKEFKYISSLPRDECYNIATYFNGGYVYKPNKLSLDDLDNVVSLLQNTDFSIKEIADKFNVTINSIYHINSGFSFKQHNLSYPLRKLSSYKIDDVSLGKIYYLLKETDLSSKEIAELFNCHYGNINAINTGSIHFNSNLDYPIRDYSERNKKGNSQKEVKYCLYCNISFNAKKPTSKYCSRNCSNLSSRKVNRPSKDELLLLINSGHSYSSIGIMYNVTPNAVKKWLNV